MDSDFDVDADYIPWVRCKYKGVGATFEYVTFEITPNDLDPTARQLSDAYDFEVFFCTNAFYSPRSGKRFTSPTEVIRDAVSALIASAVLCNLAGGTLDALSDGLIPADRILEMLQRTVPEFEKVPSIRILRAPDGEAPLHVRQAWADLVLPITVGRCVFPAFGVLSGPKTMFGTLWKRLRGDYLCCDGYAVSTADALEILATADASAAQWWRDNTPHLINRNHHFVFQAEVCEVYSDNPVSPLVTRWPGGCGRFFKVTC
jgi:hypothetical protein